MAEGWIIKALSGYYDVKADGQIWRCRARGVFKKRQLSPLVGDRVRFDLTENGEGYIQEIQPRTTELIRPPVANADQAVIVNSLVEPDFQPLLIDKFLVHAARVGMQPLIVLTKRDLCPTDSFPKKDIQVYREAGFAVVVTSVTSREGLDPLAKALVGHVSVLAGQSGVGKSSLLNELEVPFELETGAISPKLGRGRHTTRHVEMLPLPQGGWVVDTPGFSQLSFKGWSAEELGAYFPEMAEQSNHCKFRVCLHHREPHCAVKAAVDRGTVSQQRYDHYLQFLDEIQSQRRY